MLVVTSTCFASQIHSTATDTTITPERAAELFIKEFTTREFWEREARSQEFRADTLEFAVYHLMKAVGLERFSVSELMAAVESMAKENAELKEQVAALQDRNDRLKKRRGRWRLVALAEAGVIALLIIRGG